MPKPELEFHLPAAGGDLTQLTRFAPGTDTTPDGPVTHEWWEEVLVLEGDLTDVRLGRTFTQGMSACRPPGTEHGPWTTERGVLMLEIRPRPR